MHDKKHSEYYPNKIAKKYQFDQLKANTEKFELYRSSVSRDNLYYADQQREKFLQHKRKPITDEITKEYIDREFRIWDSWKKSGMNIFHFSHDLIELLKDTDVSDIELPLIKLPYKNLYIDISQADLYLDIEKTIPIEGVFVGEETNDDIDEEITYERVISFDFTGDYIENYKHINKQLMEYVRGFHSYTLYFDPKANINKVGQSIVDAKDMFIKGGIAEDDMDTKLDLYKLHSDFIKLTVNLVINCLLYLSLKDNNIEEKFASDLPLQYQIKLEKANTKKRKEAVLKDIKESGFTKIKFVGKQIKKSNKFIGSTNQVSPHWRRGHWRNQKFGEHLQDKKLIWIMPTIVNKDKGNPVSGHVYSVTE